MIVGLYFTEQMNLLVVGGVLVRFGIGIKTPTPRTHQDGRVIFIGG